MIVPLSLFGVTFGHSRQVIRLAFTNILFQNPVAKKIERLESFINRVILQSNRILYLDCNNLMLQISTLSKLATY